MKNFFFLLRFPAQSLTRGHFHRNEAKREKKTDDSSNKYRETSFRPTRWGQADAKLWLCSGLAPDTADRHLRNNASLRLARPMAMMAKTFPAIKPHLRSNSVHLSHPLCRSSFLLYLVMNKYYHRIIKKAGDARSIRFFPPTVVVCSTSRSRFHSLSSLSMNKSARSALKAHWRMSISRSSAFNGVFFPLASKAPSKAEKRFSCMICSWREKILYSNLFSRCLRHSWARPKDDLSSLAKNKAKLRTEEREVKVGRLAGRERQAKQD